MFAFDLNGLKQVNDHDGHAAGDALLKAIASFLSQFFRVGDRVIRQGGDEFVVLLPATGADEAERIRARLNGPGAVQHRRRHAPALLDRRVSGR